MCACVCVYVFIRCDLPTCLRRVLPTKRTESLICGLQLAGESQVLLGCTIVRLFTNVTNMCCSAFMSCSLFTHTFAVICWFFYFCVSEHLAQCGKILFEKRASTSAIPARTTYSRYYMSRKRTHHTKQDN